MGKGERDEGKERGEDREVERKKGREIPRDMR